MNNDALTYVFLLVVGMILGCLNVVAITQSSWRSDTVERGLAVYCPDNGHWAWKGECEK